MIIQSVLLIVGAYLLGSVSSAYLIGRLAGKDLRQYGSGNLGGSMVYEHVGFWAAIPVFLYDLFKSAFPTWLALQLGLGEWVAAAAGLAAVAGHCWSIFVGFTGGRGMLSFLAVLLVLWPWGGLWLVGLTVIGFFFGDSAPWLLAALVTMPLFSYVLGGPAIVGPLSGGILLLGLAKRLEANRRPLPPPGPERRRVLLRRAFLDRDIADHKAWVDQQPEEETEEPPRPEDSAGDETAS